MSLKSLKHAKSAWRGRSETAQKPWGHELVWSSHESVHGKILYIKAGSRTSLKYHSLKSETLLFISGVAEVTFGSEHTIRDPVEFPMKTEQFCDGEVLLVQSGCPYRIEAIEDCEVIEIGNHLSDSPIRIEDDYGRINNKGK